MSVLGGALLVAALAWLAGCSGSSPAPPTPGNPPPTTPPNAIPVRGTERLSWTQAGDVSDLRFVAYVDDAPVSLDRASCDPASATPEGAACLSPLPALGEGVHRIELTAVSASTGLESPRSPAITVEKLAGVTAAGSPWAASSQPVSGARNPAPGTLTTFDGFSFDVRIVSSGLRAPSQIAAAPDGRLLVAESDGRIRILSPAGDESYRAAVALDAPAQLDPPPAGALGLALHPAFARNHLVYISYVARDERGAATLHLVRFREAGDTLGEPAVVLAEPIGARPGDGPRLAFGPDGQLYLSLPIMSGWTGEPGDYRPGGLLLRVDEDRRRASRIPMPQPVMGQPIAFAWHPVTLTLWAVLAGNDDRAALCPVHGGAVADDERRPAAARCVDVGRGPTPGGLLFEHVTAARDETPIALVAMPDNEALWRVRPGRPGESEVLLAGAFGRIGDIVQADGGRLFISTRNRDGRGRAEADDDVIVRLTPRTR